MNNEIKIRLAIPEDANQLASLAKRGMPGYPFESIYDPIAVAQEIETGSNRLVATNEDNNILGTAVLGDSHMAEIKRVLVDPDARKHGLGIKLTSALKTMAREKGVIPWADVRADQIGMQRAAHHYYPSLTPVSLEMGKHVVYSHNNEGPARESMVHMSGLALSQDTDKLTHNLIGWSRNMKQQLADNMLNALSPQSKNQVLVRRIIPSAQQVKSEIESNIRASGHTYEMLNSDIILLKKGEGNCLVISPDASGFIENDDPRQIIEMTNMALSIGLQIVTCYLAISDVDKVNYLFQSGMEPAMIRPWQANSNTPPVWQVGLRKTANTYKDSLHGVNLDPSVHTSIIKYINLVKQAPNHNYDTEPCF